MQKAGNNRKDAHRSKTSEAATTGDSEKKKKEGTLNKQQEEHKVKRERTLGKGASQSK